MKTHSSEIQGKVMVAAPDGASVQDKTRPAGLSSFGAALAQKLRSRAQGRAIPAFELRLPEGGVERIGEGAPAYRLSPRNVRGMKALAALDEPAIAEAYIESDIDFEGDMLSALDLRKALTDRHPLDSLWRFVRPLLLGNVRSDKDWVGRHYDYGDDFYFAFLDPVHRLYSQARFESDDQALADAAENKLKYILRACRLKPGSHVLDVGGGWASFASYAATRGVDATMLTISKEQYAYQSRLAKESKFPGALHAVYESVFAFEPGRQYDAIVLLGVMEHLPDYKKLFARFDQLLRPGARLYMDFAANRKKFNVSSFTYRFVFPGDHTPVVLPDLFKAANGTRFEPVALHNDRHSYYLTLAHWAKNLEAAHDRLAPVYGERTYRLFQLYLWGSAHQFLRDGELESYRIVFQKGHGAPSGEIGLD